MAPAHIKSVNIYDAKTQLSRLIAEVESGDEITISRNGRPAARLVPYRSANKARTPGAWRGQVDIGDDFDAWSQQDERDWYGS